jgi:hypothetical protein
MGTATYHREPDLPPRTLGRPSGTPTTGARPADRLHSASPNHRSPLPDPQPQPGLPHSPCGFFFQGPAVAVPDGTLALMASANTVRRATATRADTGPGIAGLRAACLAQFIYREPWRLMKVKGA